MKLKNTRMQSKSLNLQRIKSDTMAIQNITKKKDELFKIVYIIVSTTLTYI